MTGKQLRVEADNIEIGRAEVPEQESTNWQNVKVYAASPCHDRIDSNKILTEVNKIRVPF